MTTDLDALAAQVEDTHGPLQGPVAETAAAALSEHHADGTIDADAMASTDMILHLTDTVVPGWSIHLRGRAIEPNGHWNCTLRRNDARDNDEFIGRGKGPTLSSAILAALLRVVGYQMGQKQVGE